MVCKAMKKRTPKSLKAELDAVFSRFIRRRGMSASGMNQCVSCGAVMDWQRLQCGHYYRRQHLGTRWNENNCWPQCMACNVWRRGNYASFARFMYDKFSKEDMDELDRLHRASVKLKPADLQALIEKYKEKT